MQFYNKTAADTLAYFSTDPRKGLSTELVAARRGQYGENTLRKQRKKNAVQRFLDQFKDAMILILLAAAVVSFLLAFRSGETVEFFEPLLILAIVFANACIGVAQEAKAEHALEALADMRSPKANVLRDGRLIAVNAETLVPGDILCPQPGDRIAADARLLSSEAVKCDESALTGESGEVEKNARLVQAEGTPVGDRADMLFAGCCMTRGNATAIVTATGMNTEIGKIAGMLNENVGAATPLQEKLARLGSVLGLGATAVCGMIFAFGVAGGYEPLDIFMTSVSLAVSAIPEGLPAIVTVILSAGVVRMARKNALIRRLPAVETLGGASVICTDKTGTLTMNQMRVTAYYASDNEQSGAIPSHSTTAEKVLACAALCCGDTKSSTISDDPTELAILQAAEACGLNPCMSKVEKLAVVPFDSERKRMSMVVRYEGKLYVIVKGAFDGMLSSFEHGSVKSSAKEAVEEMSRDALRVLAVGVRELSALPKKLNAVELEAHLRFVGLIGMTDPPRPEAAQAVAECRRAGIRAILITGDHPATAGAIAVKTGILTDGRIVTGEELDSMTDTELEKELAQIQVYARVSPENKLRIVRAWQEKGETVAMTGDGVNDAPALGAADIGCAMGKGTDVAKGASDMILTDENFATIVDAVREGRGIYANIRKVVGFLLGTNFGEVFSVFFAMLLWREAPLVSMQLLWINLVTDGLPAVALGMEKVEKEIMQQKPRPRSQGLFAEGLGVRVVLQGCMFALLTLLAYAIGREAYGIHGGQTMAFCVLSLTQLVQAYNMRSERSLFHIGVFSNKKLNGACGVSVLMVAMVLFTEVRAAFGFIRLEPVHYGICLGLALIPFVVEEIRKSVMAFFRKT